MSAATSKKEIFGPPLGNLQYGGSPASFKTPPSPGLNIYNVDYCPTVD